MDETESKFDFSVKGKNFRMIGLFVLHGWSSTTSGGNNNAINQFILIYLLKLKTINNFYVNIADLRLTACDRM